MAKKTLVSASPEASTAVAVMDAPMLPAVFSRPVGIETQSGGSLPYVVMDVSTNAKKFAEWVKQGIAEHDTILCHGDAPPVKLNPFKFMLARCRQYWTINDSVGAIIEITDKNPGGSKHKELFETVVLVLHDGKVTPATCAFKGPKTPPMHKAVKAVETADTDEWFRRSPEHERTSQLADPNARFTVTVTLKDRTNRTTGKLYKEAVGVVEPTSLSDAAALKSFDPKLAAEVIERFNERCKELDAKVK